MELVNKINEKDLYAARAVADQNGNNITGTYATKSEIPSVDGLMAEDKLTIEDGKITKYDGTPFAGQGGSGGSDETVLWEGKADGNAVINLSESMNNFEKISLLLTCVPGRTPTSYYDFEPENSFILAGLTTYNILSQSTFNLVRFAFEKTTESSITLKDLKIWGSASSVADISKSNFKIYKVIGINRKEGN